MIAYYIIQNNQKKQNEIYKKIQKSSKIKTTNYNNKENNKITKKTKQKENNKKI